MVSCPEENENWAFSSRLRNCCMWPETISNTNTRLMAFSASHFLLLLDPPFGIHSHKTLDTAQPCHLSKPNWKLSSSHGISTPANIKTQFLLQSLCHCKHVISVSAQWFGCEGECINHCSLTEHTATCPTRTTRTGRYMEAVIIRYLSEVFKLGPKTDVFKSGP